MKVLLSLGPGLVSYFLLCFQAMLGGARSSSPGEVVCHPFSKQHGAVGTHTYSHCLPVLQIIEQFVASKKSKVRTAVGQNFGFAKFSCLENTEISKSEMFGFKIFFPLPLSLF